MFKKLLATLLALFAAAAFAAVDVNKATQAELESVKGIGPAISAKILDERKKAPFKDWNDLVERVKGVGDASASKLSTGGLTVNGAAFTGAPAAPATAKKDDKPAAAAKADDKKAAATAAAPAPAAAPATKPEDKKAATAAPVAKAEDKKAAAAKEKEEKAAAKAKEKEEKAAAAKKAKDDKAAAKPVAAKASEAKPTK